MKTSMVHWAIRWRKNFDKLSR